MMTENRTCQNGQNAGRETICIDCNRVLDSCKDKDCFPDVRVYLTDFGQELIEKNAPIRVKSTKIVGVNMDTEPVPFNRGFYQVLIRFYVKLECETCITPGRPQDFEGIAVCDKKVILYGSEGNVNIFKSCPDCDFCPPVAEGIATTNRPTVVLETVDPICLSVQTAQHHDCPCCCTVDEIPENVCSFLNGCLTDGFENARRLYATLGFFSVIRIERPGQYLIQGTEYSVPDKECVAADEQDPCALFDRMAFPIGEFSPSPYRA